MDTFPYLIFKPNKALYGFIHAPRAWYEKLSSFMKENGFVRHIHSLDQVYEGVTEEVQYGPCKGNENSNAFNHISWTRK